MIMKEPTEVNPIRTHLAAMSKEAGGDHFHIHATDDGRLVTHQVSAGSKVQGPHDQKNLRSVKQSLAKFLDEESQED